MPSALVAGLSAQIREVAAMVGPGSPDDPAAALTGAGRTLAGIVASERDAWSQVSGRWSGDAADAAEQATTATLTAMSDLADRTDALGIATRDAGDAIARAHVRLRDIALRFEQSAAAMEPHLNQPGVVEGLLAAARDALDDAIGVVDELRSTLDGHTATLTAPPMAAPSTGGLVSTSAPAASAAVPAAALSAATPLRLMSAIRSPPPTRPSAPGTGPGAFGFDSSAFGFDSSAFGFDSSAFGEGVAVRLPDGSVVSAPNAVAADAVRHALTQLGVPYRWGGTTAGVGLDCSGLTQWAYRQAGLDIPRLAQEQDIGSGVNPDSLRPGDLAVWDGHVAMIVGNGLMVEAGDPVQLSPIRTTNSGQGFQGFWRPTA